MSKIYKDLEESLLFEFNSTTKQSLEDISNDEEEKNKIIFNISGSTKSKVSELRVDYSDFRNHIFFGSAYSAVNFAVNRVFDYPLDGELKDVNEWRDLNSGFENWFFDQWPKSQGYLKFDSNPHYPFVVDHQQKLGLVSGSFTLEAVIHPNENAPISPIFFAQDKEEQSTLALFLVEELGSKSLQFLVDDGTNADVTKVAYDSFLSSSRHVAVVRDFDGTDPVYRFYIDGELVASNIAGGPLSSSFVMASPSIKIGVINYSGVEAFFSGAIDEVRFWDGVRSPELIRKNKGRTIHANHSGGLQLYYRFDEPWMAEAGRIFDYSGNGLHGIFSGSFNFSNHYETGSVLPSFKNSGAPILDLQDSSVSQFILEQQESGSLYDSQNPNHIFELTPSILIDDSNPNTEETRKFLLLLARHWDRIKLYIEHVRYIQRTTPGKFNDVPDSMLNLIARDRGMDLADIYSNSDPLQYFYGEDILTSGDMDSSLEDVSSQLKRNILNNLIYLYKTKSTREAIQAALRTIGVDEEAINVNEYSILSGGIKTSWAPKTVERKVLRFTDSESQYVSLFSGSYSDVDARTYQFRVLFESGSYTGGQLTSSIFRIEEGNSGSLVLHAQMRRENDLSSYGRIHLLHSSSSPGGFTEFSSSVFNLFDEGWVNLNIIRKPPGTIGLRVLKLNGSGEIELDDLVGTESSTLYNPDPSVVECKLGSVSGQPFYGYANELRVWKLVTVNDQFYEWTTKDFESLALENFLDDIDGNILLSHLKMNDFTSSNSGAGPIHDYVDGKGGATFNGFFGEPEENFPGKYIFKLEPSYSYDFAINNDKVRVANGDRFTKNDLTEDAQFLSVDFSPVAALNKEIVRWFGDLSKFSDIVGRPYQKYRDDIFELNQYRTKFFKERFDGPIDYSVYFNIVKWFDLNFSYFLSQLVPLEIAPSISNFVVEPSLFEHNKVKHNFPFSDSQDAYSVSGAITNLASITASSLGFDISLADPGRFGAALSASGHVPDDAEINYDLSFNGSQSISYKNLEYRKLVTEFMKEKLPGQFGNHFYIHEISSSNYMKDVLNINPEFSMSDLYLSSSQGLPENVHFSGTIPAVLDSRWLWYDVNSSPTNHGPEYDFGIGYGGAFGQLWNISKKSALGGLPTKKNESGIDVSRSSHIGERTEIEDFRVDKYVIVNGGTRQKTQILWPLGDDGSGVLLRADGVEEYAYFPDGSPARTFGNIVEIEGYNSVNIQAIGNVSLQAVMIPAIKLNFKFQFFEDSFSETGFEGFLSSSIISGSSITKNLTHSYEMKVNLSENSEDLQYGRTISFFESFERDLPKTKYMRVFVEVNVSDSDPANYMLLIKGVFSKEPTAKDGLKLR